MTSPLKALLPALMGACLSITAACASEDSNTDPIPLVVQSGDVEIAGEIHRAGQTDAPTAIIIIGGSGVGERSDTAQAVPIFLTPATDAVILDRRGHGLSGGRAVIPDTENTAWLIPDLAGDIVAVANALRARGYDRIGLAGSSMGGWVGVAAAARSGSMDFLICIVGGAVSVEMSDTYDILTDQGVTQDEALRQAGSITTTVGYDPAEDLAVLTLPVLFILGEADDSNPSALDIRSIEALQANGADIDYILVPGADHNLVNVETGEPELGWISDLQAFIATQSAP